MLSAALVVMKKVRVQSSFLRPSQIKKREKRKRKLLIGWWSVLLCCCSCSFIVIITKSHRRSVSPIMTLTQSSNSHGYIRHTSHSDHQTSRPRRSRLLIEPRLRLPAVEVRHQPHAEDDDADHGRVWQRVYQRAVLLLALEREGAARGGLDGV